MTGSNVQELEAAYSRFLAKVSLDVQPDRLTFSLPEFCNKRSQVWKDYSGWAGVYYIFSDDGIVHYIGEGIGLENGVGYEVDRNSRKFKLTGKPAMNVGLITFGESDLPFALALELFLIRDLSPRCNTLGKKKNRPS